MEEPRRKQFLSQQVEKPELPRQNGGGKVTYRLRPVLSDTSAIKEAMLNKAKGNG
jgi:hypothetical protein